MNKRIIVIGTALLTTNAQAREIVVEPSTPVQNWNLITGQEIRITNGGTTNNIRATGTIVNAEAGSLINGQLYIEQNSAATLQNAIVNSATASGIHVDNSTLELTDSTVDGMSRGVNVLNDGEALVSGSTIYGHGTGSGATVVEGGMGFSMLGGTADISDSDITGERYGMVLLSDSRGTGIVYYNNVVLNDVKIEGKTSSAIHIDRPRIRNESVSDVLISNGTELKSGNGTIIETVNGAVSNIIVDSSMLNGDIITDAGLDTSSNLTLQNGASLEGRLIAMSDVNLGNGTQWTITGDSDVGALMHAGEIIFSPGLAGRTLTVRGDYKGNDGLITFNSVLGDDKSQTDRMIVEGNTTGNTFVSVNNLGGSGAETINGIELITVSGISDGTFTQRGRIVAGSYDYFLEKSGNNWRLCSGKCVGDGPVDPGPVDPGPVDPGPVDPAPKAVVRPEVGSYIANSAAASEMFTLRQSDHLAASPADGRMWIITRGNRVRQKDTSSQLSTKGNTWVTMLGGDFLRSENEKAYVGVMAGYGYNTSTSMSSTTHYTSKGNLNGYSTGLYAGWRQLSRSDEGVYLDSWLQYSWFTAQVKGEELDPEKYKLNGATLSLEAGYRKNLIQSKRGTLSIVPGAQLIWSGISLSDHKEANGTEVHSSHQTALQTRMGIRMDWESSVNEAGSIRPYGEINWVNSANNPGEVRLDNVSDARKGSRNLSEIRTGIDTTLLSGLSADAGIMMQNGGDGYRNTGGGINIKWRF